MNILTKTILIALLVSTPSVYANGIDAGYLVTLANDANKQLPFTMKQDGNEMRLDRIIAGPGLRYTYIYTIVIDKVFLNKAYKADYIQLMRSQEMRTRVCSSLDMQQSFFKNGVTISYSYRTTDGSVIVNVDITPKDCGYTT